MSQSDKNFWQSPLGLAIVGGAFALVGVYFTWALNQPDENSDEIVVPTLAERQATEKQRRYSLVKNCKQSAQGRFEAASLAQPLLRAVKAGTQTIKGGGEADAFCRNSKFIDATNIDTGVQQRFVWMEDTTSDDAKVICQCSN